MSDRVTLPRPYRLATFAVATLASLATLVGLLVPGFYRDAPVLLPQLYGQDLLTLAVAVPALLASALFAARGSLRGYVAWLGTLGYLLYAYASYAFVAAFNELFLVYVALLGLTLFTLVGGLARLDAGMVAERFGDRPVRSYVAFQLLVAGLVGLLWLGEVVPATLAGSIPPSVVAAEIPTNAIHVLDLGVVLPAFALSAYWLARRRPWGYAFTGVLLVKGTTLGLSILSMILFMLREGIPVALPQVVVFAGLSLLGAALVARFLLALDGDRAGGSAGARQPAVETR